MYLYGGSFVTIKGNAIGTNAAGTASVPSGTGIYLLGNGNVVGGTAPGDGNVIAYHTDKGVVVDTGPNGPGTGNTIIGNAIYANGEFGIDLDGDGVTPNDPGDGDSGPNRLQNFPVLTSIGVRANTTVRGTLNSTPGRQFRIEVFSNTACDSSGNGEGETYLGFVNTATTDGNGNVSFIATFPQPVQPGRFLTATATDLTTADTSEFSSCRQAVQADIGWASSTKQPTEARESNLPDTVFSMALTSLPTADVTVPLSVSDPTEGTIVGPTSLTFTPTNGTSPQTVSLTGVDDALDDGDVPFSVVVGTASSADPNYHGINPTDIPFVNVDDDNLAAQCAPPRPRVNLSVARIGGGQLRATVSVSSKVGTNELQAITWTRFDTATVVVDGIGPVQVGQQTSFLSLTQAASFVITRTPGASSGTVRLTVTDVCGAWPTFVGGGPNAW
jgi:hypothetical protein